MVKKKLSESAFQKYNKYGNMPNMDITPTSVTTTIITKTTTTTEYPPLYFAPPELPEDFDSSQYPLANTPTPSNLKNFHFDLNGSPTYFKEIELRQSETNSSEPRCINNGLKIIKTNTVNSKLVSNSSNSSNTSSNITNSSNSTDTINSSNTYIKRINRKRPAPDTDSILQNDIYFENNHSKEASSGTTEMPTLCKPHKRHASQQEVNPREDILNKNVNISNNLNCSSATPGLTISDSECSKNLPSPSMSPTMESRGKINEISKNCHSTSLKTINTSYISSFTDITPNQNIPLANIPYIISTFDVLPSTMKSYILLHLLRRCRVPTLQYISSLILTSLKYDFFGLLPISICYQIIQYLDLTSIAKCSQVSKTWYKVFNGPGVDVAIWKPQLINDFWLDEKEIKEAIDLWKKRKSNKLNSLKNKVKNEISSPMEENDKTIQNKEIRELADIMDEDTNTNNLDNSNNNVSQSLFSYQNRIKNENFSGHNNEMASSSSSNNLKLLDGGGSSSSCSSSNNINNINNKVDQKSKGESDEKKEPFEMPPNIYKYLYRRHYLLKRNWKIGKCHQVYFPGNGNMVITCLQFDNDKIISGSDDNIINIYDTATGQHRKKLVGHTGGVWALHYYGNTLVSGSTDRTVRIWDIEEGKCTHLFEGHTSTVRCLQILIPTKNPITGKMEPEFPLIVTGSRDTTLKVWRLPNTKRDKPYFPHSQHQAEAQVQVQDQLATTPLITIAQQQQDTLSTAATQTVTARNFAGTAAALGVRAGASILSANNGNVANGGNGNNASNSKVNPYFLYTLCGHTQSVRAVAGSGNVLVSGSYDSTVRVWDLSTGESVHLLRGHLDKVYSVGYSPELERAASGSMDTFVRVWSTKTGQCLYQLEGHSSLVGLLEVSPNYIVSAAADNTLRIWSPTTGRFISTLYGHPAAITCFHHNARLNRIVSGSEGAIKLWELCSDENKNKNPHALLSEVNGVSSKTSYGTYVRDLVTRIQCVWKIEMDERRLVCALQRDNNRTCFEVLDYGVGLDKLEEEFINSNCNCSGSSNSNSGGEGCSSSSSSSSANHGLKINTTSSFNNEFKDKQKESQGIEERKEGSSHSANANNDKGKEEFI